jgi:hypothetical protein
MAHEFDRIEFLLTFAETDFAKLRPGSFMNLQDELLTFLDWPPARRKELTPAALTPLRDGTRAELLKIAEAVRQSEQRAANPPTFADFLEDTRRLAKEGRSRGGMGYLPPGWAPPLPGAPPSGLWHPGGAKANEFVFLPQSTDIKYVFPLSLIESAIVYDENNVLSVAPPTLSARFFLAFMVALLNCDLTRIRQCSSVILREKRVCSRFFVAAHPLQEFCSAACGARERMRRMRAAEHALGQVQEKPRPVKGQSGPRPRGTKVRAASA